MRHTRATQMLEASVAPAVAALELGHSIKMFFEVYAKWVNVSKRKEDLAKVNRNLAKVCQRPTLKVVNY